MKKMALVIYENLRRHKKIKYASITKMFNRKCHMCSCVAEIYVQCGCHFCGGNVCYDCFTVLKRDQCPFCRNVGTFSAPTEFGIPPSPKLEYFELDDGNFYCVQSDPECVCIGVCSCVNKVPELTPDNPYYSLIMNDFEEILFD